MCKRGLTLRSVITPVVQIVSQLEKLNNSIINLNYNTLSYIYKKKQYMQLEERKTFICDCNSLEHQYTFWYDEEDNDIYFEPHLNYSGYPWYKRVAKKIAYVFGYTSRYGAWDEVIIKNSDVFKLKEFLSKVEETEIKAVASRGRD